MLSLATIALNCITTVDEGQELCKAQKDLMSGMYSQKCASFMTACRQLVTMFLTNALLFSCGYVTKGINSEMQHMSVVLMSEVPLLSQGAGGQIPAYICNM